MWMSVGNTRSRKVVYAATRLESIAELFDGPHVNFTVDDLFDAYAIYEYLAQRNNRLDHDVEIMEIHCLMFSSSIGEERVWEIAHQLKLFTSVAICEFGKTLVNIEFKNPN